MRSDHLTRHLKQHSEKDTNNPATNIYGTNNYNTTSGVLADKEDEVESKTKETGARKSKVNGHVRRLSTLEPQVFAISVMISPALKTG